MKATTPYSFRSFFFFVLSLFIAGPTLAQQPDSVAGHLVKTGKYKGQEVQYIDRQLAVKRVSGARPARVDSLLRRKQASVIRSFDKLGWGTVELTEGKKIFPVIEALERSPLIEVAEPVTLEKAHVNTGTNDPSDPYYDGTSPASFAHQWALKNTGQSPPGGTPDADIDAPEAWDVETGDSDVVIAVLDSGIPMQDDGDGNWDESDLTHPDLDDQSKIILGPDYAPFGSGDGSGARDEWGHGTHVGGIAAAETNNDTGIAGLCWNCKLMVIQVFDQSGDGSSAAFYDGVTHAVDYAENNNVELVINYSGGGPDKQQKEDAVDYARDHGVPLVASAGNEYGGPVEYPAAYSPSFDNVIAVSSTDHNDNFSSFSSKGSEVVVAAPGGYGGSCSAGTFGTNDIFSTTPNYSFTLDQCGISQDYGYLAGTSMAAPQVAGTVGLMLSRNSGLTGSKIRSILESTAKDLGTSGFDEKFGYGRINAFKAVDDAIPPLYVDISGSVDLDSGEEGYWAAYTSGGIGSITYSWEVKQTWSSTWSDISCSGTSCSYSFINTCDGTRTAQVRVTATSQMQADTSSQAVQVSGSGGTLTAGDVEPNAPPCPSEDPDPIVASKASQGAGLAGVRLQAEPAEGREVLLSWQARGSAPPAPVTVQHRTDSTAAWADLGTVRPADSLGTSADEGPAYQFQADRLDPGTHQFRLAYAAPGPGKQSMRTSRVVTAKVEMNEAYRLSTYPNPVRERATVELAVKEQQDPGSSPGQGVTVTVYDVLGRQVTTLYDGRLPAQETKRLSIDAAGLGLSSGTYVVRASGESFVTTKRLTVVR